MQRQYFPEHKRTTQDFISPHFSGVPTSQSRADQSSLRPCRRARGGRRRASPEGAATSLQHLLRCCSRKATLSDGTEKNSHLEDLQALGPLEIIRADLNEDGSFDQAVSGCDYVFPVAAPVNMLSADPEVIFQQLKRTFCITTSLLFSPDGGSVNAGSSFPQRI
ncbi:hypothetical protein VPH35_023696 [Triticum aestivum]